MLETEMAPLNSAQLRHREAVYFCSQFLARRGPPQDSYFHMVCYFDAFLFALVSVEEMVDDATKQILKGNEVFRFIKALRNVTMHHSVLAGSSHDSKFLRPFARHLFNSVGGSETSSGNLAINYDRLRKIFDRIEADRANEKPTLDFARAYISKLEARSQPVFLEHVLHQSLAEIEIIVG